MSGVDRGLVLEIGQEGPIPLRGALHCAAGELTALVGPSGAGKTSLLRVIAGLMRPTRARVTVDGEPWFDSARGLDVPPQRRHVGFVFQQYALMPHLSALGNVALALGHLPAAGRAAAARGWLERVGLGTELHARRPLALSGGQQQRVAVARALAREPRLLLLDEPFSAVDQMTRRGLYQVLADLRRELTVPILLVTHDLGEARALADQLAVMDRGEVLQQGRPAQVHRAPRNARVADLVGILNRFAGVWEGPAEARGQGLLRWQMGETPGPLLTVRDKGRIAHGQRVDWIVPGDALSLHEAAPASAGEFAARVIDLRQLGDTTLASVALTDWPQTSVQLTLSGPLQRGLRLHSPVTLAVDLSQVHVMPFRRAG
jgi:molybdate transport system ATP-binding protein